MASAVKQNLKIVAYVHKSFHNLLFPKIEALSPYATIVNAGYDIENYKAICTASKVVYTNGNVGSGVEFLDFKNQTYGYEAIINGKELSSRENCKINDFRNLVCWPKSSPPAY